jgi:uncharacterized protein (TIGR03083 family)
VTIDSFDAFEAIARHSAGLADIAEGNPGARIEHCPEWTMADLVWHLTNVHWFWATIAAELPSEPPGDDRRPERPTGNGELIAGCRANAKHLGEVLRNADPSAACWTWAPAQNDVAFIIRHQVQEAAVHHWDAGNAVATSVEIDRKAAADAVDEFLKFSVSTDADPAEPAPAPLDGSFALRSTDTDDSWIVCDGGSAGTTRTVREHDPATPGINAKAEQILLWLYGRVDLPVDAAAQAVVKRFKDLTFTD